MNQEYIFGVESQRPVPTRSGCFCLSSFGEMLEVLRWQKVTQKRSPRSGHGWQSHIGKTCGDTPKSFKLPRLRFQMSPNPSNEPWVQGAWNGQPFVAFAAVGSLGRVAGRQSPWFRWDSGPAFLFDSMRKIQQTIEENTSLTCSWLNRAFSDG